jgi:hypothetical protein
MREIEESTKLEGCDSLDRAFLTVCCLYGLSDARISGLLRWVDDEGLDGEKRTVRVR